MTLGTPINWSFLLSQSPVVKRARCHDRHLLKKWYEWYLPWYNIIYFINFNYCNIFVPQCMAGVVIKNLSLLKLYGFGVEE